MIAVENIADWRGQEVVDPNGEKLGKLDEVYYDGETDEPAFLAVKTGLVSKSVTLVPLVRATVGRDYVRVDRRKAVFKKAPSFDTDKELTLDDEAATYEHYSMDYTPAGTGARRLAKR
ncbi:PRC-barrel domain-containing protein [Solirubrobacter sp. CPCC 204708]|uniref:PRC-barrel domain-containing protein n=1 Tax=Solirubrobacter deserti TaxID=2282478 RepID=A0ABT4RFV2_9ACTN|nr:PRC-barrel domain-containing protein [Solirubrobacter deserti]MBE2318147.1 PRC-barrel domain-containing protein [Solirubrobacter deserti]MDA0137426.1 PRC-barrel domain-containing protein [Solirubrobacter deserti]